jgi:hypothetical protein
LSTVLGVVTQAGGWVDLGSRSGHGPRATLSFPRVDAQHCPHAGRGWRIVG